MPTEIRPGPVNRQAIAEAIREKGRDYCFACQAEAQEYGAVLVEGEIKRAIGVPGVDKLWIPWAACSRCKEACWFGYRLDAYAYDSLFAELNRPDRN